MAGIVYPERKPEHFKCPECGDNVFEIHNTLCARCGTVAFLNFRHAMDWPLDDEDYYRLGLKERPPKAPSQPLGLRRGNAPKKPKRPDQTR